MSVIVTIPEGFQYVAGALLTTVVVFQALAKKVRKYSKRAAIAYPQIHDDKAEGENSKVSHLIDLAQRAHQNSLEQLPKVLVIAIISGLKWPIPTAVAMILWNISRISFARAYLSGDPEKRNKLGHLVGKLSALGLMASAFFVTGSWIWDGLKL